MKAWQFGQYGRFEEILHWTERPDPAPKADEAVVGTSAVSVNFPDLKFTPGYAVPGVSSISLVYTSVRDLRAVETMVFNDENLICRVYCHYQP